ncbi:MAG: hypothetical protein QXE57_05045 [Nitrososphaerales archaeon]
MVLYQLYLRKDDLQIWEEFKEIAKREGKPISTLLKELMVEYVKKHSRPNPQSTISNWVEDPTFKAYPDVWRIDEASKLSELDDDTLQKLYDQCDRVKWLTSKILREKGFKY